MNAVIVAGLDESAAALRGVEYAACEARLRNAHLRIVHMCPYPELHERWGSTPDPVRRLDTIMRNAADRARELVPEIRVTTHVLSEDPFTGLVAESKSAMAMVIGGPGVNRFAELMVGSMAEALSAHASCPVLVARGRPKPTGPVLLGVDGCENSDEAIGFAFSEASYRRTQLIAMHAWNRWTAPLDTGLGDQIPAIY